jgi:hypothetical protein
MTQQIIRVGNLPNDGKGDPLRTAFNKINSNFTELYLASDSGTVLLQQITLLTTTNESNQVFDIVDATTFNSAKYLIQAVSGTAFHLEEILMMHDNTNAYIMQYARINSVQPLVTFNAVLENEQLKLLVTPVNAETSLKATKILV